MQSSNSGRSNRPLFALLAIVAGIAVAWLVQAFVIQVYLVPTGSMVPTLQVGDRVLVDKVSTLWRPLARGDVVVFDATDMWSSATNDTLVAKRVIGLPGDHVVCCNKDGRLLVNGHPLVEHYAAQGYGIHAFDVVVPKARLWVMGDQRAVSVDSRAYLDTPGRGTVPMDHVVGRMVAILWPWQNFGILASPEGGS